MDRWPGYFNGLKRAPYAPVQGGVPRGGPLLAPETAQKNHTFPSIVNRYTMTWTRSKKTPFYATLAVVAALRGGVAAFAPPRHSRPAGRSSPSSLSMALDDAMKARLEGIRRSYQALTERLADPDVIGDSNLLRQVSRHARDAPCLLC